MTQMMASSAPSAKSADNTKLSGAVSTLEGREVIQRDLDRPQKWAHVNLIRFNKAKCKVLPLGRDNLSYLYKLRGRTH